MRNLLPIGQFSKFSRLSIKALRHYDELGLLVPAYIDGVSGYRYYTLAQIPEALRVEQLRSLGMPLADIQVALKSPRELRCALERHRSRMLDSRDRADRILGEIEDLLAEKESLMSYVVAIKEVPAIQILSIRLTLKAEDIPTQFPVIYQRVKAHLIRVGERPVGPAFSIYHNDARETGLWDLEVAFPVARPMVGQDDVKGRELPGGRVATTMHSGSYETVVEGYQALAQWIDNNGHEIAGPPRETYLVGSWTGKPPSEYRTELDWPVR